MENRPPLKIKYSWKELKRLPPKHEGLRRLSVLEKVVLVFAYFLIAQQWFVKQTIPRRIVIGFALYLTVTLSFYSVYAGNTCVVKANGVVIAVAADENTARKALDELVKFKSSEAGGACLLYTSDAADE